MGKKKKKKKKSKKASQQMPAALNEQIVDEVTGIKFNTMATIPATVAELMATDAVALQRRSQDIATQLYQNASTMALQMNSAVSARASDMLFGTAQVASAFDRTLQGLQNKLAEMEATLGAGQQFTKTAQTTPPQTGTGGAFGSDAGSALLQQIVNSQNVIANGIQAILATLNAKGGGGTPTP